MTSSHPRFEEALAKHPEIKGILDFKAMNIGELASLSRNLQKFFEKLLKDKKSLPPNKIKSYELGVKSARTLSAKLDQYPEGKGLQQFERRSAELLVNSVRSALFIEDRQATADELHAKQAEFAKTEKKPEFQNSKTSFDIRRDRLIGKY